MSDAYPLPFQGSLEDACKTAFHVGGTEGVSSDNPLISILHYDILASCSACVHLSSRQSIQERGLQHNVCFKGDHLLSQY